MFLARRHCVAQKLGKLGTHRNAKTNFEMWAISASVNICHQRKWEKPSPLPTHGQFFPIPSDTKMLPRPPFHINVLPTSNLPPNTAKKFFSNVYKFLRETARKKYGQIVSVVSRKMEEKEVPHQSQRHTTAILAGEEKGGRGESEFSRIMSLPPGGKREEVNKKSRCPSFDSRM